MGGRGSHFWPFRGSNSSQNIVVHTEKARWNGSGECQAENNRESKWRGRRGGGDEGIRRGVGRGPQKVTNVSVNDIWRKKQAESAIKLLASTR